MNEMPQSVPVSPAPVNPAPGVSPAPANPASMAPANVPANPASMAPANVPANPASVAPANVPANPASVAPANAPDIFAPSANPAPVSGMNPAPVAVPVNPVAASAVPVAAPVAVEPDYRALYENLRRENEILRQNAETAQRSPVQAVSGGGVVTVPNDDFIRGFDSDTW